VSRRSEPFDAAELDAIRAAVVAAESRSAGEIVTLIVERCDTYQGALWKSAALGAMAATLVASVIHGALGYWGGSIWLWLALPAWAGAGIGFVLPLIVPVLHRAAVGAHVLDARVAMRARAAFAESEVFATRARTGLLLFVALFEHRVEIVCDRGIEPKVATVDWEPIVDRLTAGLRQGRAGQSLVAAIAEIGSLLESRGVTGAGGPDIDELPDLPTVSRE
jgi:putative membrane protein